MKKATSNNGTPQSFEEVFGRKLDEVNAQPRTQVWERLENSLNQQPSDRKPAFWFRRKAFLMAAVLLLLGSVAVLLLRNAQKPAATVADLTGPVSETKLQETASTSPAAKKAETETPKPLPDNAVAQNQPQPNGQTNIAQKPTSETIISIETKTQQKAKNQAVAAMPEPASGSGRNSGLPAQTSRKHALPLPSKSETNQPLKSSNQTAATKAKAPKAKAPKSPAPANTNSSLLAESQTPERTNQPGRNTENSTGESPKQAGTLAEKPIASTDSVTWKAPLSTAGSTQPDSAVTAANKPEMAVSDSVSSAAADSATQALAIADTGMPAEEKPAAKLKPASFGIYAGPAFFKQHITLPSITGMGNVPHAAANQFTAAAADFNANTRSGFSYKAGITFSQALSQNLSVKTGLGFARLAAQTTTTYMAAEVAGISSAGQQFENQQPLLTALLANPQFDTLLTSKVLLTQAYEISFRYQYLQVPVQLQYLVEVKKWSYFAAGGIELSRLVKSSIEANHPEMQQGNLAPESRNYFRKWQWSGLVSAGVGYSVTDRLQLQAGADLSLALAPMLTQTTLRGQQQQSPRTLGFTGGIIYTLRK